MSGSAIDTTDGEPASGVDPVVIRAMVATDRHSNARSGFGQVGRRERLGRLDGARRDVVLMERRSTTAGS